MSDSSTPPSPDGFPLFGTSISFFRDPLSAMQEWASTGDVVDLDFPGQEIYMITDPSIVEEVLEYEHDSFTIADQQRDTFQGVQEKALQRSTGDRWTRQRKALASGFARDNIERYAGQMVTETEARIETWDDGQQFDLYREMQHLTLAIVSNTLVDIDFEGNEHLVFDATEAVVARGDLRRLGQFVPDWVPTPFRRRFRRKLLALDDYVGESVRQRQASADDGDVGSVLLAAYERGALSIKEVQRNLMSLLLVGHVSPALTLTYIWYLLEDRPDVHEELVAEYDEVVGDGRPSMDDYDDLDVARSVVSETLRLFPTLFMVMRKATEPVTVGGYDFDAGSEFMLPQWVIHRDERFWDDPDSFEPSRWQGDDDRPNYAYFPFSGGPRHCIGVHFSRVELVLTLATMVGRVEMDVTMDGPLSLKPSLTLKPENDVTATVSHR